MGKASRAKKEQRQAMAGKPGWQQEASRQAKARQREEVERHNAAQTAQPFEQFMASGEDISMIVDGKLCVGKAALFEVYESWVRNEMATDSAENLDEIAALGVPMFASIWDVKIEVIDLDEGGVKVYFDPLKAAFVMDKEKCFEWFVHHALKSKVGHKVASNLFAEIIPGVDQLDATEPASIRCRSAKLLIRKLCEFLFDHGDSQALEPLKVLAGFSTILANELQIVIGKSNARVEREEIEKSLAKQANVDDCEPNPEAIRMADEAVGTAQEASKSEKSGRGWARSL